MMYAIYRDWGDEAACGSYLLFVTADKQVAEDAVILAELEKEELSRVLKTKYGSDVYHEHHRAAHKSILTIDPDGGYSDHGYHYEATTVR